MPDGLAELGATVVSRLFTCFGMQEHTNYTLTIRSSQSLTPVAYPSATKPRVGLSKRHVCRHLHRFPTRICRPPRIQPGFLFTHPASCHDTRLDNGVKKETNPAFPLSILTYSKRPIFNQQRMSINPLIH